MPNKTLKKAALCAVFSIIFAVCGIFYSLWRFPPQSGGAFVFAATKDAGTKLNRIKITTPQLTTTLVLENDMWRVAQEDYYFANFELVQDLFDKINQARYYHQQNYSKEQVDANGLNLPQDSQALLKGSLIETFAEDKQLNAIVIGQSTDNKLYQFIKEPNKQEIWLMDHNFTFPSKNYSWLMQPILQYPRSLIETIVTENSGKIEVANRASEQYPFYNRYKKVVFADPLLERTEYLIATKVLSPQNFDEQAFPYRRRLDLITFSGLITTLDIFYSQTEYWLKISFSTTNLPTTAVNAYIKDNRFLYDNWYFQISPNDGNVLVNFRVDENNDNTGRSEGVSA